MLYQHINNRDVAVEVLRIIKIPRKEYYRIKVRWWNVVNAPYSLNIEQWLTDASRTGNKKDRQKYPISKWEQEWRLLR